MQKKLLAAAVAGALVAPAAFAQTSVTISGALNLWYESAGASGPTNANTAAAGADVKRRDRIQDGNGSNIRFTVVEDLGSGMQAFGQVESAVFGNADTRPNAFAAPALSTNAAASSFNGWATRNSGVGLRSSAWGEVLLGIWDIH
ncbi:MAG: porin, partial [Betaproteobacteria bacterium]|nr:porin [Betaproteobacteria bacterium]